MHGTITRSSNCTEACVLETTLDGGGRYPHNFVVSTVVRLPAEAAQTASGTDVSSRHVHRPGKLDPESMHMMLLDGQVSHGVEPYDVLPRAGSSAHWELCPQSALLEQASTWKRLVSSRDTLEQDWVHAYLL